MAATMRERTKARKRKEKGLASPREPRGARTTAYGEDRAAGTANQRQRRPLSAMAAAVTPKRGGGCTRDRKTTWTWSFGFYRRHGHADCTVTRGNRVDQHRAGVQFVADSGRKTGCGPQLSVAQGGGLASLLGGWASAAVGSARPKMKEGRRPAALADRPSWAESREGWENFQMDFQKVFEFLFTCNKNQSITNKICSSMSASTCL